MGFLTEVLVAKILQCVNGQIAAILPMYNVAILSIFAGNMCGAASHVHEFMVHENTYK